MSYNDRMCVRLPFTNPHLLVTVSHSMQRVSLTSLPWNTSCTNVRGGSLEVDAPEAQPGDAVAAPLLLAALPSLPLASAGRALALLRPVAEPLRPAGVPLVPLGDADVDAAAAAALACFSSSSPHSLSR